MSISDSTSSAAYSVANTRTDFASSAIRNQNEQEQQVADRLKEAQATTEADREARKIPGLGEAVDITV